MCVRMMPDADGWVVTYAWHATGRCWDSARCDLPGTLLFRLVCRHFGVCQGCGAYERLTAPADGYGGATGAGCCMQCVAELAFGMAWCRQDAMAESVVVEVA